MIYIIYILQQSMGSLPMDAVRSRPEERERWTLSGFLKTELLRKEVNDNN
jgi:hypothetical protein